MQVDAQFPCASCGRRYRWKQQLAGRKVKCACGGEMIYPPAAPVDGDDLYDVVEPDPRAAPAMAASTGFAAAAQPQAAQVPLAYQTRHDAAATPDEYFPDKT